MATSSKAPNIDQDTVEQFIAVTGADRSVAQNLLEACAGNLDLAVGMHMDSGQAGPSSSGLQDEEPMVTDMEEGVRAPIPQRTEVLVEDEATNQLRRPRRYAPSVFDGFRDFQAESFQYDERGKRLTKKRNLEDLFRPPVDMTHKGTFQSARDFGSAQNRWLLVNVQNVQEFPCQLLNRDVWSNLDARQIVKDSFVFWQVYNDSEEGKRFMQFYKFTEWPYVAVIDPFTGENQIVWNKISDGKVFCELAKEFLSMSPVPDATQQPTSAKRARLDTSIVDATEQEQLEAAIQASLKATKPSSPQYVISSDSEADVISSDSDTELETFSGSDTDVVVSSSPPRPSKSSKNSTQAPKANGNSNTSTSSTKKTVLSGAGSSATSSHDPGQSTNGSVSNGKHSHTTQANSKHKSVPSSSTKSLSSSSTKQSSSPSSTSYSKSSPSSKLSHNPRDKLSRFTRKVNSSEINIIHESDDDTEGEGSSNDDPRVSAMWSASNKTSSSRSSVNPASASAEASLPSLSVTGHRLGLNPPPVREDDNNSLLDMLGTRRAEVATPESFTTRGDDGEDSVEEDGVEGQGSQTASGQDWKEFWGNSEDPQSKIMLRFPDNKREQIELPNSSSLKALLVLCSSRGYPAKDFELVTNFPRRKLSQLDESTSLKDAGLYPQETVFVQDI